MFDQLTSKNGSINPGSDRYSGYCDGDHFLSLANLLPEIIVVTDKHGRVSYLNKAGSDILGFSFDSSYKGRTFETFFKPEDRERLKSCVSINNGEIHEFTALKDDGTPFPVLLNAHHTFENGLFSGLIVVITDRSHQKGLEQSLEKAEKRCRDIFQNTWEYWALCDFEGNILEANITHNEDYNITENDLKGLNIMDFLHDDLSHVMKRNFQEVIKYGKSRGVEHVKMKDGEELSFEFNKVLVYDGEKPVAIRILARDITEEVRAKKSLEISETLYRGVFENTGLPTIILEDNLLISMVNVRFVELVGYDKYEIENRMNLSQLISSDEKNREISCILEQSTESSFKLECRIINRRGETFDMIMQVGNIAGTYQKVVSFIDITSRKQAEASLLENSAQLQKENSLLRSSLKERFRFGNIIGKCHVMQDMYESIVNAADTNANVVIYGESGTGKELVAREIHQMSNRKKNMFVAVNCGAIPENIIESEFFGYKKGAFTGAYNDKPGYLDFADGGTLFLDEVGEITLSMQVKLLRIIDCGDFIPLGSNVSRKTDVRIIAATNRNLRELIKEGLIREDFFYRIHIIPIHLPPLRERKEDIPLLIDHFVKIHGDPKKNPVRIQMDRFLDYDWPGNVRELQNVVHRFISMNKLDFSGSAETIQTTPKIQVGQDESDLISMLDLYEKEIIHKTLIKYQWHRGKASEALGINRKTLFTKIMKYGLRNS